MSRIRYAVWCLAFLPLVSVAKPVLVAVELPDRAQQASWHRLGTPTYAFLGTTAIAEVEEFELRGLAERGFTCQVVDHDPWSDDYMLVDRHSCAKMPASARVLWEKGDRQLLKVPTDQRSQMWNTCKEHRRLNRTPLPKRFWHEQLAPTVTVGRIPWEADIQTLIDEVDADTLTAHIQRLQSFVARFALTDSSYAASAWLLRYFEGLGYPAAFDSFYMENPYPQDPGWERNVVATLEGTLLPSRRFIIGGHFDSKSSDPDSAPGADDNASGVACVMEAARVLSSHVADYSLDFVCWAAEERASDNGSDHQAEQAIDQGWDLGGVVVLDMIGYMNDDLLDCEVRSETASSDPLAQLLAEVAQTYAPSLLAQVMEGGGSDAGPFSYLGYPAILVIEHGPSDNPNYHSPDDVWTTLSPDLYTGITKAAIAATVILGRSPRVVEDVTVADIGDGVSLDLAWAPCEDPDVIGYTVEWGLASGAYDDSLFITGVDSTSCVLTGLLDATTYYIAVRAVDDTGYRSWGATEAVGVPLIAPLAPGEVAAVPVPQGIRLSWNAGDEQDLAGCRILRRINDETTYDTLTVALVIDTTFVDAPLDANLYRYVVHAVDEAGNASPPSDEVWARPITLDQGILLVDETRDDMGPPDSAQDAFYHAILNGYAVRDFDFSVASGRPLLSDLGQYSTVIWHADDYYTLLASPCVVDLEAYLSAGGNFWFMGWKPLADITGNATYPKDFAPGSFPYDYLKVGRAVLTPSSAGIDGVRGLGGYPAVEVDSLKVPQASWGGVMRSFEVLTAVDPGDSIFLLDMTDDSSPYENSVCGISYMGADYKTVYLGFPLYFMDQDQARLLAQQVMADFGELGSDRPGDSGQPLTLHLSQNSPNPFGGETTIRYWLPSDGGVHLGIYDIGGRLVRTLLDAPQERGQYALAWDGEDAEGAPVGSGIYVCRLRVEDQQAARRVLVVR